MKKIILLTAAALLTVTAFGQPASYVVVNNAFLGLTLEGGKTQIRLADLNQDGHLDLASIGDHGSPNINTNQHGVSVFFGDGTGAGWQLSQSGGFGYGGCAFGDINNDGKVDVAYSMHHVANKLIEAALGNGTGTSWTLWDNGLASNGESWGMFGTDLGDVNNDGWLDIASNAFGLAKGVHIYKNNTNGTWTQTYSYGSGGTTGKYVQFGDIDGDGNMDFVTSNEYGSTYFGNGNGSFTLKKSGLPALPNANSDNYEDVALYDIDNDGDDDFVFAFNNLSSGGIRGVYVYKWNRNTQQWDNASTGLPTSQWDIYYMARLGDLDMDGFADLITFGYNSDDMQIYKGNGGASWTLQHTIPLPGMYYAQVSDIAIGDVDHSGYPDVVLWGSFANGNELKLIKDAIVPTEIGATLTYPKGGECWPNNAVRFITWISAIPSNHASSVKIEYSITGNGGPWTTIASSAPNNGIYQWNVPATVVSSNCFIRITASDNQALTTAVSMNTNPFNMGCTSSTTGVEEMDANVNNVFPNPMTSSAQVFSDMVNCHISIIDISGKLVKEYKQVDQFPFSIEKGDLVAGVYVIELRSGNRLERKKLLVE